MDRCSQADLLHTLRELKRYMVAGRTGELRWRIPLLRVFGLQEAVHRPVVAARGAQDGSKTAQDGAKTAQDASKTTQDGSKTAEAASKTAPRRPKMRPRRPKRVSGSR